MTTESLLKFGAGNVALNPSPICPDWILEGNPVARNRVLSSSADGSACTLIWDCTAGKFNWFYSIDETVYVIEGSVVVKDPSGLVRRVGPGETIFFPAGSQAEWTVEKYIRKVAFCRTVLPRPILFAKRCLRFLKRIAKGSTKAEEAPAMFSGG